MAVPARNFLNPALTARAFLYFSYAPQMSGNKVWTAVDGYSGATALGAMADAAPGSGITEVAAGLGGTANGVDVVGSTGNMSWWDAFFGNMHGSIGETSTFCCLLGAIILIATRIGSWRIMAGCVLGMVSSVGPVLPAARRQRPFTESRHWWHLVIGGFAFGTVFMATDPVSAVDDRPTANGSTAF